MKTHQEILEHATAEGVLELPWDSETATVFDESTDIRAELSKVHGVDLDALDKAVRP